MKDKQYYRDYYLANKEKKKQAAKKHYENNKERVLQKSKEYRRSHPAHNLWNGARSRARLNDIEFSISVNDIVVPTHCPVFGIELVMGEAKLTDASPSLDRIDSSKGYVPGNIAVISYKANRAKSNCSYDEILAIADYIKRIREGSA